MADILNKDVVTFQGSGEGGAWGAALLAAVGNSEWPSPEAFFHQTEISSRFSPRPSLARRYDDVFEAHRKLFPDFQEVYADLEIARGKR